MSIAHIQRLPPELLAHIFLLTHTYIHHDSPEKMPWSVLLPCQINQHWRDVVLSTPTLWSNISVDIDTWEREYDRCKVWLARAGLCPLSLTIRSKHNSTGDDFSRAQPLFDLLIGHCDRWQQLVLDLPWHALVRLTNINDTLPLLESLRVSVPHTFPSSLASLTVDVFQSAPTLRHFRIDVSNTDFVRHFPVPWAQLTSLQTWICTSQHFLSILNMCPNLEALTVSLGGPTWSAVADLDVNAMIQHTQLTILCVISIDDASFLFSHVSFPALRDLTLMNTGTWVQASFNAFLDRSYAIRQLTIHIPQANTDDIAGILRRTPDLTQLHVLQEGITEETLELLLVSADAPTQILVPRLRCLSVNVSGEAEGLAFARAIGSRWRVPSPSGTPDVDGPSPSVSRIERVLYWKSLVPAARATLSGFATEGLDVRILITRTMV